MGQNAYSGGQAGPSRQPSLRKATTVGTNKSGPQPGPQGSERQNPWPGLAKKVADRNAPNERASGSMQTGPHPATRSMGGGPGGVTSSGPTASQRQSIAGSAGRKPPGPTLTPSEIVRKGGIQVDTRTKAQIQGEQTRNPRARGLNVPGPRNLADPAEYVRQGGELGHFRTDQPTGAVGVADLGTIQDDLLGDLW